MMCFGEIPFGNGKDGHVWDHLEMFEFNEN